MAASTGQYAGGGHQRRKTIEERQGHEVPEVQKDVSPRCHKNCSTGRKASRRDSKEIRARQETQRTTRVDAQPTENEANITREAGGKQEPRTQRTRRSTDAA